MSFTRIIRIVIFILVYTQPDCSLQCLLAAKLPEKQVFRTKHFSVSPDTSKWKFVKQKQGNPTEDTEYIETDLGNALSDPIIGKGSERVLFVPEEALNFVSSDKMDLFISCMPLALWQIVEKNKDQTAVSARDSFLLVYSRQIDIRNSDIEYFEKVINNKRFFGIFYNSQEVASFGPPVHTMHSLYLYLPEDLRKKYWIMVSFYDNNNNASIDKFAMTESLQAILNNFEVVVTDCKQDYLDYILYSAQSLYIHLRQRTMYEGIDKHPLSVYKIPINIEQESVVKRRMLNSDHLDVRKHPIQERIKQTTVLLKEAGAEFPAEPKIYYGLGLLYEFNSFGERYGDGFNQNVSIEAYRKALTISPEFNPARYNLAVLYLRKGDVDEGINELEKIITGKNGQDWEAYCALAYAYEKKNNLTSSTSYYKLALANFTAEQKRAAPGLIKHLKDKIKR